MTLISKLLPVKFLGATLNQTKVVSTKVDEIIDKVNTIDDTVSNIIDNTVSTTMFATYVPKAVFQNLTGAGAINVTSYYTTWNTTAANAATLADGTKVGQLKKIRMTTDGGVGTLTPAHLNDGTTISFDDVNDYVELLWDGNAWFVIENVGCTIA